MEEKIINIEMVLAHHEEQISQMSDIITDQWKQIELLKCQFARLNDKISAADYGSGSSNSPLSVTEQAAMNKPPHY